MPYLLLLVFLLLVMLPKHRIVFLDGFNIPMLGEALRSKHLYFCNESDFKTATKSSTIANACTNREEHLPIPRIILKKEVIRNVHISAEMLPAIKTSEGKIILPQSLNGGLLSSIFSSFGIGKWFLIIFVLPLLFYSIKLIPRKYYGEDFSLFLLLILFNPLMLFYSYHIYSIDILNFTVFTFLFSFFIYLWKELEREVLLSRFIFYVIVLGIVDTFVFLTNPANIFLIIFIHFSLFFHSKKKVSDITKLTLLAFFIFLISSWFAGKLFTFKELSFWKLIHSNPLVSGYFSSNNLNPLSYFPAANIFVFLRALILSFPALILAFFGLILQKRREKSIFIITLGVISIVIITPFFQRNFDFSNYILTARLFFPLTFMLAIPISLWLKSREYFEKLIYEALIVLVGIAGYAFFLARMRIDLFNLGILSALDKNLMRIYLVFQHIEFFHLN